MSFVDGLLLGLLFLLLFAAFVVTIVVMRFRNIARNRPAAVPVIAAGALAPGAVLPPVIPAPAQNTRWAAYLLFVAVFFVTPGAAIVYLWDDIISTFSRWQHELSSSLVLPRISETPTVSMPDVNWATIGWWAVVAIAIVLLALLIRWAWRRPAAAGARTPLLPRFVWQALLAVILIAVLFVVPWEGILPVGYRQYAPVNWLELLRNRAGSWTQQTWLALILLVAVATLLAFKKKGWAIAVAALAALVFIIPSGVMQNYWPNGAVSFSAPSAITTLDGGNCSETLLESVPIDSKGVAIPNCQLNFSTSKGCLMVRGTVDPPVKVCAGQKVAWPSGFRALKVWAVPSTGGATTEAEITAALCPFSRPLWNGRCIRSVPQRQAAR